jgi:hypothetical protein
MASYLTYGFLVWVGLGALIHEENLECNQKPDHRKGWKVSRTMLLLKLVRSGGGELLSRLTPRTHFGR